MSRHFMVLTLIAFFMITGCLNAQIVLQGVVTDNGAETVENALVEVIDQANAGRTFSGITNAGGHYSITINTTGLGETSVHKPGTYNLLQNYPNPFNPSTVIGYEIPHSAQVRIEIYNVLGQKIKTLLDTYQTDLYGRVIWDGANDQGRGVSAGVYLYTMVTEGKRITRKMLLLDGHLGNVSLSGATGSMGQSGLYKAQSSIYLLRVSGNNIETWEQHDVQITENKVIDVNVIRTVTDVDGNVYRTVKIGEQWWMAENLKVTHYRNGDEILNNIDDLAWNNLITGAWRSPNNDDNNITIYGRLYNWFAVIDNRDIAPYGWHVPGDEEWKQLELILGMSPEDIDGTYNRGIDEGGKLKEAGTTHWMSPNTGATNETRFTALPAGTYGIEGSSYDLKRNAAFWTSTIDNSNRAWYRLLTSFQEQIDRYTIFFNVGLSIRCIQDNHIPLAPSHNKPGNNITLPEKNPILYWFASEQADSYSLQVATDTTFTHLYLNQVNITATSFQLDSLREGTTYYWRVNATNSIGTSNWSDPWSFTTVMVGADTVTDIDGNIYRIVKIGEQWWMAENLRVTHYRNGDPIAHITNDSQWEHLTSGAYCYYNNNNDINSVYGNLYNWYAINDTLNIAPAGWHIPSDEEWKQLEIYLGMSQVDADMWGYRGTNEGGKLKEKGEYHWSSPNTGATNEYGFSALPGGNRRYSGEYMWLNEQALFWTSTIYDSNFIWSRGIEYNLSNIARSTTMKNVGYSVRCVKD